jgi:hypothetical protein
LARWYGDCTLNQSVGTSLIQNSNAAEQPAPVQAARVAIWRLFEEGYVDEDMATAGLLAVDLGTRRRRSGRADEHHVRIERGPRAA